MSDRYQGFTSTPVGKLLVKNLGLPEPDQAGAVHRGRPAGGRHRRGGRQRPAGRVAAGASRRARHRLDHASSRTSRPTRGWSSTPPASPTPPQLHGLRDFFSPKLRSLTPCPRVVVIGTPPEQVDRRRAGRPARPRGVHAEPRQGDRPRRHRPAGLRRRRGRVRRHLDPRVPPLPQVRLRLRPGDPGRRARHQDRRRGRRLDPAAGRPGRPGHRRQPRHRRADRPGAAPRRRDRGRVSTYPSSPTTCRP